MSKFRSRLLFGLLTLIIAVLVGLGLLLGQLFKSFYLNTFNQRLEKETSVIAHLIEQEETLTPYLQTQLEQISETLSTRITLTDRNGIIIYDTTIRSPFDVEHQSVISNLIQTYKSQDTFYFDQDEEMFYYGAPIYKGEEQVAFVVVSTSVEPLHQLNQQIWGLLIASLGTALVVILLLGVRITTHYTKPIESATKVAMELAKGNYQARTYEEYLDETAMLSQSINILARNLHDMTTAQEMQQDRLKTLIENMGSGLILIDGKGYINLVNRAYKEIFNVKLGNYLYRLYYEALEHKEIISLVEEIFMTEVKVRKQMILPLNIERRHFEVYGAPIIGNKEEWKGIVLVFHDITELKKLEQVRKDFVANVSHELKTPITSIKGFSETLLDGALDDKETSKHFLSIILKESERLQSLIQDLLDLSKIEQQGYKLNIQQINLQEILEDVIIMLSNKAESKNINLQLHRSNESIQILGDSARLKQVFINLINNALAYTPSEGSVSVSVQDLGEKIQVNVQDTGIGMKEEEIPRIFERFYRVDRARSRNSGGTGLGLAIVKHLIEAHKGMISVSSQVDKGTTFEVKLWKNNKDLQ